MMRTARSLPYRDLPDRGPLKRDPPDRDPLGTESQKGVKTLPSRNFVCGR